jgi:hypothetical protein
MASERGSSRERSIAYFRRIGEYKRATHQKALEEHLALPIEQRIRRSWEFYEMSEPMGVAEEEAPVWDAVDFYARARQLGLCQNDS